MNKVIVTLVGPTCSGKTTLKDQMLDTGEFVEVISHTTRPMRTGEVNGKSYHFVSQEEFDQMEMLERVSFNGNTYGGSVQEFEKAFDSGLIPVIIVEPNGNGQVNLNAIDKDWTVINVWVGCPVELQAERLVTRLLDDYKNFFRAEDAGFTEYNKLVKEYVNRLTTIQTVESDWPKLFKDSVSFNYLNASPAHHNPSEHVMVFESFTAEDEDHVRSSIIDYAKLMTNWDKKSA